MKKHILDSLYNESYVCLKPSKVDGVGVFALRYIPANVYVFYDMISDVDFYRWEQIYDVHPNVKEYIKKMCHTTFDGFYLSRTFNNISFAYYLNHSDTPNVQFLDHIRRWKTIKEIHEGEELFVKYKMEDINWI